MIVHLMLLILMLLSILKFRYLQQKIVVFMGKEKTLKKMRQKIYLIILGFNN